MSQKIAIVTGASSGIGRAVAEAFLAAGHTVVLAARREDALKDVARRFPNALAIPTDVSKPGDVVRLFDRTREAFGRVDLLFNNAGMSPPYVPLDEIDDETVARTVATNLTGCVTCAREAFRLMKAQTPRGGRIINNGSIAAHTPRRNATLYTVTKHAITGLTKSLALDGRDHDIACSQIDIGNVATDMSRTFSKSTLQSDGVPAPEPLFDLKHVVDAVMYMAGLPPEANVLFMTVLATKMPFVGRG